MNFSRLRTSGLPSVAFGGPSSLFCLSKSSPSAVLSDDTGVSTCVLVPDSSREPYEIVESSIPSGDSAADGSTWGTALRVEVEERSGEVSERSCSGILPV